MLLNESATLGMGVDGSLVNTQNVHFQEDEYENALFQLNKELNVFAAVMTMSRRRQTYVLFCLLLIFVICAASAHTKTSLPYCTHRLPVVRSVHNSVDLLTFEKELPCYVCLLTLLV